MDLRKKRTKQSIINAFLELRSKKALEKITVKELSELAFINKATFYSHYKDIYDLSEQLENETIDRVLTNIAQPEELITKPKEASEALAVAFISQSKLINILFSNNRTSILVNRLENKLKAHIFSIYPEYKNDLKWDIILTFLIQGGFYTYLSHSEQASPNYLIDIVGNISEAILTQAK